MIAPGLLVIRLTLAVVLVAHGAHALFGVFAGPGIGPGGLTNATTYMASLGLTPAFPLAVLDGVLRLAGGVLLGAGWFTRPTAVALAAYLGLLILRDTARWGFFLNWTLDRTWGHGMEMGILLVGGLTALACTGAGAWSIDGFRSSTAAARASGRARLRNR